MRKLVRIGGLALRGLVTQEAVGRARDWPRRLSTERGPARCARIGPCRESATRATWWPFERLDAALTSACRRRSVRMPSTLGRRREHSSP